MKGSVMSFNAKIVSHSNEVAMDYLCHCPIISMCLLLLAPFQGLTFVPALHSPPQWAIRSHGTCESSPRCCLRATST